MKQLSLGVFVVLACAWGGWTVYQQAKTTPVEIVAGEETEEEEITLLNTETGEVFRSELIPTPAVDPKTGKRTLTQGLFCKTCQKWYPIPPVEMTERSHGVPMCPRDQTRLTTDGPLTPNNPAGGGI